MLEATRISGVIIAAPLAWSSAPTQARVGLTLALAMAIHGTPTRPRFMRSTSSRS
jgi:flagellar biosynthesis protein FliR